MRKVKVTSRGLKLLFAKKKDLISQLKHIQSQKGEAAEIGGNQWHDNFAFEDLVRQETAKNKQIADISLIIQNAEVVEESPKDCSVLRVGHLATLLFDNGEEKTFFVAGYGESDLSANPKKIEYLSPLIKDFFEQPEGTETEIELSGIKRLVVLSKISRSAKGE